MILLGHYCFDLMCNSPNLFPQVPSYPSRAPGLVGRHQSGTPPHARSPSGALAPMWPAEEFGAHETRGCSGQNFKILGDPFSNFLNLQKISFGASGLHDGEVRRNLQKVKKGVIIDLLFEICNV